MDDWTVYIETEAPEHESADPDEQIGRADVLMDLLGDLAAVPAANDTSWSVYVSLDAPSAEVATATATEAVSKAADKAELPLWPIVRIETVRSHLLDSDNMQPNFPDIVGSQEVTELLGITRQRLHELRTTGRFPEPMMQLAATPVWMRAAIDSFAATWDRRPGRRANVREIVADLDKIMTDLEK
jgi:predicted DNA-binding transcriptional regulator AlpA